MSLLLGIDTVPKNLVAKTHGPPVVGKTTLHLGDYEIGLQDFLILAAYVITNTNLDHEDDPRLVFLRACEHARITEGFGSKGKRIELDYPPPIKPESRDRQQLMSEPAAALLEQDWEAPGFIGGDFVITSEENRFSIHAPGELKIWYAKISLPDRELHIGGDTPYHTIAAVCVAYRRGLFGEGDKYKHAAVAALRALLLQGKTPPAEKAGDS